MKRPVYYEALQALKFSDNEHSIVPLEEGLIHRSYKVIDKKGGDSILLQMINSSVFKEPSLLQKNYELLWKYLRSEHISFIIPEPKRFSASKFIFQDTQNNYWRAFEYMQGAQTYSNADTAVQARAVAKTFAGFTASFKNFNVSQLDAPLPGFHHLSLRYHQFQKALHNRDYERLFRAAALIDELKKRERYVNFFEVLIESDEFPLRVMHHDAKISNVLFDEGTGKVICPVDLDTVMPGYYFSDLGDMIRSMACSADENSTDFDNLSIRKDFYEAIMEGYGEVMNKFFSPSEKKYIHYTGLLMIYMQALRFLTDYLQGDPYYRVTYGEQNFDRAKNQTALLKKLEEFLKAETLLP